MTSEERRRRRFSEEFKKEQVHLIESGKVTIREVSKLYEVNADNVRKWLDRLGKKERPGRILVSSPKEYNRLQELEKENRKLTELIGKQQIELIYKNELIQKAEERLGKDFKKNK